MEWKDHQNLFIQMLETMKQMEIQIHGKLTSQKPLFSRILFSKIKIHSVSSTKASDWVKNKVMWLNCWEMTIEPGHR